MEKYISAFNEIDLLMEGLFERLNIGIGEINAYPSEDMFRIIVNKTEVESLNLSLTKRAHGKHLTCRAPERG